jgi:outer membrane immunogenic protein
MKIYRPLYAIALGSAAAASPAIAQDATSDGFYRETHFDGLYVSGFFGLDAHMNDRGETIVCDNNRDGSFGDTVSTATGANAFSPGFCNGEARGAAPSASCSNDKDGIVYGGRIGLDSRMGGNLVVGGLVEFNKSQSKDGTSAFSTTPASYGIVRRIDYAVSARARAGFTPGGGALFYVTGGGSYAKINHRFFTTNTANAFDEQRDGKMVWGYQGGGGGEVMLSDHVSLGLEYLYSKYKDNKYSVAVTQGTAAANNPFLLQGGGTNLRAGDRSFELHSLRATVSYQF